MKMTAPPDYAKVREVCPICSQGWVLVARDNATHAHFFRCDECGSEWEDARNIQVGSSSMRDDDYEWDFVESRELATHKVYKYVINKISKNW